MNDRKIILETRVGSHLYGTNRPDSDEDFQGIFLPTKEDLLSIQNCSTEWSLNDKKSTTIQNQSGDVDRKFYSLKRFLHLAVEGQPGQLELFFATPQTTVSYDKVIWPLLLDNIGLFLCRKSIVPFIGFALSQAHKATIKGETLNLIRDILATYPEPIKANLTLQSVMGKEFMQSGERRAHITQNNSLKIVTNSYGFTTVEIGGRNYDAKLKLKTFIQNIKELESRYGKRARAAAANIDRASSHGTTASSDFAHTIANCVVCGWYSRFPT